MKFLYSDALDSIDPDFDFRTDANARQRRGHDDTFPHEHLARAPYDGMLISRAIVGDARRNGKYSHAQRMRLEREGARAFLRYDERRFPGSMLMGDNGAFTYSHLDEPPYTVEDTLDYYDDGRFTHGCSLDHIIFEFDDDANAPSEQARRRFELTLGNAEPFLRLSRDLGPGFKAVGVVQGWSAASMGEAARSLAAMGYDYLALGGLVPLRMPQITAALAAVRQVVPDKVKLHVLGFGKVDHLDDLRRHGVASFDTTSPLRRAFMDARRNYYAAQPGGGFRYYMAVRIPQVHGNDELGRRVRTGELDQERLQRMEKAALRAVRDSAEGAECPESAAHAVIAYQTYAFGLDERHAARLRAGCVRTLADRPWESCDCRVCAESGVETLLFRSSNHNRRRGFHNLKVFHDHVRSTAGAAPTGEQAARQEERA